MIYTLEDFIREYRKIKEMGWIRTHRAGPTGVGKTLEDLLGIEENNHDAPDFGEYELKSCRVNSQSMLTMFTKTPQPPKANTYLRLKYGYSSSAYDNEEKVLHSTLTAAHFVPIADTGHQLELDAKEQLPRHQYSRPEPERPHPAFAEVGVVHHDKGAPLRNADDVADQKPRFRIHR